MLDLTGIYVDAIEMCAEPSECDVPANHEKYGRLTGSGTICQRQSKRFPVYPGKLTGILDENPSLFP